MEEATRSALLELIERDALALWWRGGDEPGAIPAGEVREAAALLRDARGGHGGRETRFLDITSDIGIPVVVAMSFDADGRSVAAGFAARPDRDAAACSALRELAQMELGNRLVLMKLERGGTGALSEGEMRQLNRMRDLHADDRRFRTGRKAAAKIDVPGADGTAIALRLAEIGIPAHRVDLASGTGEIPVVKVVAPLLQSEPGGHVTPRLARMRELRGFLAGKVSSASLI